jgi:hypothetical protein
MLKRVRSALAGIYESPRKLDANRRCVYITPCIIVVNKAKASIHPVVIQGKLRIPRFCPALLAPGFSSKLGL